jgi:hypothetical protein
VLSGSRAGLPPCVVKLGFGGKQWEAKEVRRAAQLSIGDCKYLLASNINHVNWSVKSRDAERVPDGGERSRDGRATEGF